MHKLMQQSHDEIIRIIARLNPKSLLLIGLETDEELNNRVDEDFNGIKSVITGDNPIDKIESKERYDLVYLYGLEKFEKQSALHLIASLRDLHADHLFLTVPHGDNWNSEEFSSEWTLNDLIACGLHLHCSFGEDEKQIQLYRFELSDYKTTPDWLNSRFWANPELFDKYRW
jgi:hypothetical protein